MPTVRAAVDTVVVYAGLAYPDRPFGQVIGLWYDGRFDLVWTSSTLGEYRDVLLDPDYLAANDNEMQVEEFLTLVEIGGVEADPWVGPLPRIRDEHDQIWLAAALGGQAGYLVTTDPDFLDDAVLIRQMRERGVSIAPPYIFLREIERL
jgi:predicted nucleic acid-binding protein